MPRIAQREIAASVFSKHDDRKPDEKMAAIIGRMKSCGISVASKSDAPHCLAIIDKSIIWYGSINLLGHATKRDTMIRIVDAANAETLLSEVNSSFC